MDEALWCLAVPYHLKHRDMWFVAAPSSTNNGSRCYLSNWSASRGRVSQVEADYRAETFCCRVQRVSPIAGLLAASQQFAADPISNNKHLSLAMPAPNTFPLPGSLIHVSHLPYPPPSPDPGSTLRVLHWNIERCYQLERILAELEKLEPDILCLQEVDIGCKRSGEVDGLEEIAKRLKMDGWGVVEFWEIESPLRPENNQGGGVHLNAILSRFPLLNPRAIEHRHSNVDWDVEGDRFNEPRLGRRYTVAAEVDWCGKRVGLWSAHLEPVNCNISIRLLQLSDLICDSWQRLNAGVIHQLISGDFNTMAHGVARLSPAHYSNRWYTLGYSEPQIWLDYVFSQLPSSFSPENAAKLSLPAARLISPAAMLSRLPEPSKYPSLLPPNDRLNHDPIPYLSNPSHLVPCFPPTTTTIFVPRAYNFFGALDSILVRGLRIVQRRIGNDDYSASDHKWLIVEAVPRDKAVAESWEEVPGHPGFRVAVDATGMPIVHGYECPRDPLLRPIVPAFPLSEGASWLSRVARDALVCATPWNSVWWRELQRERWCYYELSGGKVRFELPQFGLFGGMGAVALLVGMTVAVAGTHIRAPRLG
ncbi:hypothetical protein HDU93_008629 [Gonapodya sp. JEL0774]|nr:hypothetical protein HDU93_008629 [Gonapodya sp. JEL0774]